MKKEVLVMKLEELSPEQIDILIIEFGLDSYFDTKVMSRLEKMSLIVAEAEEHTSLYVSQILKTIEESKND